MSKNITEVALWLQVSISQTSKTMSIYGDFVRLRKTKTKHIQDKASLVTVITVIIMCMHPTNERQRYSVTPSLISWEHTQNDPWNKMLILFWYLQAGREANVRVWNVKDKSQLCELVGHKGQVNCVVRLGCGTADKWYWYNVAHTICFTCTGV